MKARDRKYGSQPEAHDAIDAGEDGDSPILDLSEASVKKMILRAKERGYISYDELNKALPSEEMSSEKIEDVMSLLSEMGINVIEGEDPDEDSDTEEASAKPAKKKAAARSRAKSTKSSPAGKAEAEDDDEDDDKDEEEEETFKVSEVKSENDRTDDPVRMYLREMGSVELLSREGEIAIAKRIEAGRETMILGLCESPLTFQALVSWSEALNEGNMLLRDIIDLDATMGGGPDAAVAASAQDDSDGEDAQIGNDSAASVADDSKKVEQKATNPKDDSEEASENTTASDNDEDDDDEANMSLSAMEEHLKPETLEKFETITATYKKLHRLQGARLEAAASGEVLSAANERKYKKLRAELVELVRSVRFNNLRIEEMVDQLYSLNKRLLTLGGRVLRMAETYKIPRSDFLNEYMGQELEENWLERASTKDKKWAKFAAAEASAVANIRDQVSEIASEAGLQVAEFRRIVHTVQKGEKEARNRQKGNGGSQSAAGYFHCEKIHQSRLAVLGSHSGRQYRPDESGG